jgi:hypothetical protein
MKLQVRKMNNKRRSNGMFLRPFPYRHPDFVYLEMCHLQHEDIISLVFLREKE